MFPSVIAAADDYHSGSPGGTRIRSARTSTRSWTPKCSPGPTFRPFYQANDLLWLHKTAVPDGVTPLTVLENGIILLDAQVAVSDAEGFFVEMGTRELHPGDRVQVGLLWDGFPDVEAHYVAFVQLLDAGSGNLIGQHDGPPANGAIPAYHWLPASAMRDTHYLTVEDKDWVGPGRIVAGLL